MAKKRGFFGNLLDKVQKGLSNIFGGGGKKKPPAEQPRQEPPKRPPPPPPDFPGDGGTIKPEPVLPEPGHKENKKRANENGYAYVKREFSKTEKKIRRHSHGTFESALNYALGIPLPPESIKIAFDPTSKKAPFFVIVDHVS